MGLLDRFRRQATAASEVRASAPYTDAIVNAIIESAAGAPVASVAATAALEAAASAYGRAFAGARVTPAGPLTAWITPDVLNLIGRELIRRGESLGQLAVEGGRVRYFPAGSWDVRGGHDPSAWWYRLDSFGPSGNTTDLVPAAATLHVRYAFDPARPWLGLGPMQTAAQSGKLHAATVQALADEAGGPRGSLLPIPSDGEEDNLSGLRSAIATLRGKLFLVETTGAGWGDGKAAAPASDWKPSRLGYAAPDTLRSLRKDTAQEVLSACGVPIELATAADGTGQREAWRRFVFGSVMPLARILEAELSSKLELPIRLDFETLKASDLAGRARAFQSLVKSGMDIDRAAGLAGLLQPEAGAA